DEFSRVILPGIDISTLGYFRVIDPVGTPPINDLLIAIPGQPGVIIEDYFVGTNTDEPLREIVVQNGTYSGFDAINLSGIPTFNTVVLGDEDDLPPTVPNFVQGAGDDELFGTFADNHLEGFAGDDVLFGSRGNDRLEGDQGDDRLFGGQGDDVLFGGAGDNRLDGGAGDDVIRALGNQDEVWGDKGNDMIFAGADETTIMFESLNEYETEEELDTIHNFDVATDKIHVQGMFTNDQEDVFGFLDSGAVEVQGEDLYMDLGDGRAIKLIDVVEDDQDPNNLDNFVNIFVIEG
ncbi:MAG: M10 family metallopeptidase C-terminal domain-containing protein, partial [Pseudomonadota bacterium]